MNLPYTPAYCEENVWFALRDGPLEESHAVFITNEYGAVALWSQRASPRPDGLTLWDYHVVALGRLDGAWHIVDLDCTAGATITTRAWVNATFPLAGALPQEVEPRFRIVPAAQLVAHFRTDRSHMVEDGNWLAAPPAWAPLHDASNLADYLDLTPGSPAPGVVVDLDGLLSWEEDRHR